VTHGDIIEKAPSSAFDFRKPDFSGLPGVGDVLRRNLREVREARGFTQRQLAEQMTAAGTPMTNVTVSQIERGRREVSVDELVVFSAVLEKALVRLLTPRPDDETLVRVTNWRLFRSVPLRNWIVYGNASTPAAQGAQVMMRLAYCALILGDPQHHGEEQKAAAKDELGELCAEITHTR
jgi:transcriptional regulator with XRE-family HTH domain